jgi:hypothetical protein
MSYFLYFEDKFSEFCPVLTTSCSHPPQMERERERKNITGTREVSKEERPPPDPWVLSL